MMTGLPPNGAAKIHGHLDVIGEMFIPGTKLTLVVRPPLADGLDGDAVVNNDELELAIAALERRLAAGRGTVQ